MRGEMCGPVEGLGAATAQAACTGMAQLRAGGQGMCRAYVEHLLHGCDAGRVEAQRLVEGERVLPGRKEGIRRGGRRWATAVQACRQRLREGYKAGG